MDRRKKEDGDRAQDPLVWVSPAPTNPIYTLNSLKAEVWILWSHSHARTLEAKDGSTGTKGARAGVLILNAKFSYFNPNMPIRKPSPLQRKIIRKLSGLLLHGLLFLKPEFLTSLWIPNNLNTHVVFLCHSPLQEAAVDLLIQLTMKWFSTELTRPSKQSHYH